jgi:hypothetical protein
VISRFPEFVFSNWPTPSFISCLLARFVHLSHTHTHLYRYSEGVQGLAQAALLASTPQMAANIRAVLDG